ncbi:universal stress protein [Desulfallas thermosapovorans]|uniref:Nucleotide-binding universal stress UspA family protein n=1 Tax=Desulfallas thermosapovorans DSM 6562 TaxID=1121431 RepID=A0A5S4ZNI9_9FIRM|nr:universal stress protein [Desulfallas thermosapovorans]TYO93926.1 nucleotide-binding universal stress UspA family protein [Desulfallas thermosapovorans DSM 6562]
MYQNILVALHGEEVNLAGVINQTLLLAEKAKARVTLLKVKETGLIHYGEVDTLLTFTAKYGFIDYVNEIAREQVEKITGVISKEAGFGNVKFKLKLREGKPADEIMAEIKEGDYDLVVLGTKEPGPGNTSSRVKERLAREHPCTVMMIR